MGHFNLQIKCRNANCDPKWRNGTVQHFQQVWTLSGDEERTAASEPILENESKQIRCVNALALNTCVYNMRTVLIVASSYWDDIQSCRESSLQEFLDMFKLIFVTFGPKYTVSPVLGPERGRQRGGLRTNILFATLAPSYQNLRQIRPLRYHHPNNRKFV